MQNDSAKIRSILKKWKKSASDNCAIHENTLRTADAKTFDPCDGWKKNQRFRIEIVYLCLHSHFPPIIWPCLCWMARFFKCSRLGWKANRLFFPVMMSHYLYLSPSGQIDTVLFIFIQNVHCTTEWIFSATS